jgi:ATP-dependent DNA helicase RecG
MALHVNIEDLLSSKTVESDRIEYKEGWNPDAIYRSICAFANDFDNTGGGYILIGVAEDKTTKTAMRPVKGLSTKEIGTIQMEMIGFNNLIKPIYAPKLIIEEVDGRQIIILWVIAGNERPYEVPESVKAKNKNWKYFIRKYASSSEVKGTEKEELIALSNNIPFDDRANAQAAITSISMVLVQDHLRKIGSKLVDDIGKLPNVEVLKQMALLSGPDEHLFPRNVALMLFAERPDTFFPYTWVEIVHFTKDASDKEFTEKKIVGPIQQQITDTLTWLKNNILQEKILKIPGQAEAVRVWNYPYTAFEETIANCLFHRNYQEREPVKIRIESNAIWLYNSGGPDRSIKREDFTTGKVLPKRYRNRRLGDFLKELRLTEGHATGLPALRKAMKSNGSPDPVFDFDDERTWFQVMLPIHPNFLQRQPLVIDLTGVKWNILGIDRLLNEILEKSGIYHTKDIVGDQAGAIASAIAKDSHAIDNEATDISSQMDSTIDSTIAGDIADFALIVDNKAFEAIKQIDRDVVGDIAGGIAGGIATKMIHVLELGKLPLDRKEIMAAIGLVNNVKNFNTYIQPLVVVNWLTMTIPSKPTSPKQQYLATLKGRLILEFLKHKTK